MLTHEERISRLEADMEEQKRLRASQDLDLSNLGEVVRVQLKLIKAIAKTQSEHTQVLAKHTAILDKHTAILDRHTAMLKDNAGNLARLTLDVRGVEKGNQQIIGMLHTLIDRGDGR
ncbi:MAG TPA: hypothetical protein VN408_43060 [Actinoplanes sp.]|nr:hypothetical protein [Actinoplanes sp.]